MTAAARLDRHQSVVFHVPRRLPADLLPEGDRDAGYFLLDLIHRQWTRWQFDGWWSDDRQHVPLKAAYVRRVVSRAWPRVRARLVKGGVIAHDRRYRRGVRCQGYRLRPAYLETTAVPCADPSIASRIRRLWEEQRASLLPVHLHLEAILQELRIDVAEAMRIIRTMRPDPGSPLSVVEYQTLLSEMLKRFAQSRRIVVDRFGRVHTPVTSLPAELRSTLTFRGEHLAGLDVANSQPLLAGLVCRAYCTASRQKRTRIRKKRFDEGRPASYGTRWLAERKGAEGASGPPVLRCAESESNRKNKAFGEFEKRACLSNSGVPADLATYLDLCQRGRLYESLDDDRKAAKKSLFFAMYGHRWSGEIASRFRQRFPTVDRTLRALKANNYRRAAWLLQNVEAAIVIGGACTRIMRRHPHLPVFSIHDSVLTIPEHLGTVEAILRDDFKRFGIEPTLHREDYGPR